MAYLVTQDAPVNLLDAIRHKRNRQALTVAYVSLIGYDPFADDPSLTNEQAAQVLREYKAEVARAEGYLSP